MSISISGIQPNLLLHQRYIKSNVNPKKFISFIQGFEVNYLLLSLQLIFECLVKIIFTSAFMVYGIRVRSYSRD